MKKNAISVTFSAIVLSLTLASCEDKESANDDKMITSEVWGEVAGKTATIYTLKNSNGLKARISDYGGIIVSVMAPDKNGKLADIVLGFDTPAEYPEKSQYFGCITGRYANRIAKGKFTLDGTEYTLATNNGANHLHGGEKGFDQQFWAATAQDTALGPQLVLKFTSPDGDQNYPGALSCEVTYTLTHENEIKIDYKATTDKPTVLNLTNHSYFNLKGAGEGTNLDHEILIKANKFCATDDGGIPLPGLADVEGTPFDFRTSTLIGSRIEEDNEQLKNGIGYDHNWCNKTERDGKLQLFATVTEPKSGRTLEVHTTEPGLQFYGGNYLEGQTGKGGKTYLHRGALCLEAQTFPNAPNRPDYPSAELRPGETYTQTTIYKFGVVE